MEDKKLKPGIDYPGTAVVFLCHDGRGNIAMMHRTAKTANEPGVWDIGGGKNELHASRLKTVHDEVREEYCADVLECEYLGDREVLTELRDPEGNPVKNHWNAFDFIVRVDHDQVKIGEPHKFDRLEWFRLETIPPKEQTYATLPAFLAKHDKRIREILNQNGTE